jgi:metal-responsive CopG/Arc/MetJ family transcriptional regulator
MTRKTHKTRTAAIHVSLPIRLIEDFDDTLDYKQSRSGLIAKLIVNYLDQGPDSVSLMTDKQVLAACMSRFKAHSYQWTTLKAMIDHINSSFDDSSS